MVMKKDMGEKIFDFVMYCFMGAGLILILYPLYFIVIASVSDQNLVANGQVFLLPKGIQFGGFKRVFENELLLSGYRNTILYTLLGTAFNMLLTMLFPERTFFQEGYLCLYLSLPCISAAGLCLPIF